MRSVVIGTAGHIDHGKSALVRALTGTDPDRLKEEQERGITIDLGFAHRRVGDLNLAFVDVPGHERFVKNMLAGVGGMDLVMLVVAADESVMPQTREHFHICRLLHVPAGVIVLTKTDAADRDLQELAALEIRELVAGSFLADAPIVPVSARTGEGMENLVDTLTALAAGAVRPTLDRPTRLAVDRVFTVKGFGTVVTGTLVSGEIEVDDDLVAIPKDRRVKVRGLQVHGQSVSRAEAGQRVAVNLGGVELSDITRGDTLCRPDTLEQTTRLDVAIDLLPDAAPLRHGARLRFHQGTTELLGRVALAGVSMGEGAPGPTSLAPGRSAYARLRLEAPAAVTRGDRFIVRAYSPTVTIGGGVILDPAPPRGAIRTEAGLRRFRQLDAPADCPRQAVGLCVAEAGARGMPRSDSVARAGLSEREASVIVNDLVSSGDVVAVQGLLVARAELERLSGELLKAIDVHHRAHPLAGGLPREEARERVFGRAALAVFDRVIDGLVSAGRIVARERLALAGQQVSLTDEETAAMAAVERAFAEAGLAPADLASVAGKAGVSSAVAQRVTGLLLRRGRLVKVDTMHFHVDALERLKTEVRELRASGTPTVDIATFKERYAVTRKYAIPLLEYLDRERVTRRAGESRVIL